MSDTTTFQRDDLKPCPFCGTAAIEKGKAADSQTGLCWWILCGNPFCTLKCETHPMASRSQAEAAWQERWKSPSGEPTWNCATHNFHVHTLYEFEDHMRGPLHDGKPKPPAPTEAVHPHELILDKDVQQLVFEYESVLTEMRTHSRHESNRTMKEWVARLDQARDEFVRAARQGAQPGREGK